MRVSGEWDSRLEKQKGTERREDTNHVVPVTVGDGGRHKVSLVATEYDGGDLPRDGVRAWWAVSINEQIYTRKINTYDPSSHRRRWGCSYC